MAWNIEGMYYENCSCDAVCPCTWSNLVRGATNDDCRVALLFEVEGGEIEGVDVAGTTCVVIMQTPRQMLEGNFKAGLIIDEDATAEQADMLTQVFSGAAGGPMAGLAPLIGEFLGVEQCASALRGNESLEHGSGERPEFDVHSSEHFVSMSCQCSLYAAHCPVGIACE